MARFSCSLDVEAPPERLWQRITDWPLHGRWIPFTTVTVTSARPDVVGATFVGRTALGPIGFDDPMEVVDFTPPVPGPNGIEPGYCRVRKHGRVVLGWAAFDVQARAAGGSTLNWTEEVELAPVRLTRPFGALIAAGTKIAFDRALRSMARELERELSRGG